MLVFWYPMENEEKNIHNPIRKNAKPGIANESPKITQMMYCPFVISSE